LTLAYIFDKIVLKVSISQKQTIFSSNIYYICGKDTQICKSAVHIPQFVHADGSPLLLSEGGCFYALKTYKTN